MGTTSVWAVNWDGRVVARVGISDDSPTGREWATVDSEPLIHVSSEHACCHYISHLRNAKNKSMRKDFSILASYFFNV